MQNIPIQAVANQTLSVLLGAQACRINIYTKRQGLFVDLYVANAPIFTGVIALNANKLVRYAYLGFVGDLAFFDTLPGGETDPVWSGLGSQYALLWLEPGDPSVAA